MYIVGSCPSFRPPIPLLRAVLNPFIPQPVWILGITLPQVQDLALGLSEPHDFYMGPFFSLFSSLNGIPSFKHINHTTQLMKIHMYPCVLLKLQILIKIQCFSQVSIIKKYNQILQVRDPISNLITS